MELDYIESVLLRKKGQEFEDYCVRYLRKKIGKGFCEVKAKGRKGDGGRDGYCIETREYFAISSRKDVSVKIQSDFSKCLEKNLYVNVFTYVTNQDLGPDDWDVVDALKMQNPDMDIWVMDYKDIAMEIIVLPGKERLALLNRTVPFSEDTAVSFQSQESEITSITLSQSIKHYYHVYLFCFFVAATPMAIMFSLWSEFLWKISLVAMLTLSTLYFYFIKENLKEAKLPHKILYLILSEKLSVGEEVVFNERTHMTIRRDLVWTFTFRKWSADCVKTGCSGKIYLYESETFTYLGRCETDKRNHLYKVDRNFYGEVL